MEGTTREHKSASCIEDKQANKKADDCVEYGLQGAMCCLVWQNEWKRNEKKCTTTGSILFTRRSAKRVGGFIV